MQSNVFLRGRRDIYPSLPGRIGLASDRIQWFRRVRASSLTIEEKAGMVAGNIAAIERLNFTGICLQDGPLAIRQAALASVFPAQLSRALHMGQEFRAKGSHVALESFSPDSYLSGELVAESVNGIQRAGAQAATKHLVVNEQEIQPSGLGPNRVEYLSPNIDDKTMHMTYLWPFANAVRASTASIMCSYQRINGSYDCQNSKGYVIADWEGTHAGVASIEAGLDMNMPGGIDFITASPSYFGENVTTAVNNGSVPMHRVDDMVIRIMTPYLYLNQDVDYPLVDSYTPALGFFPRTEWVYNFTLGPLVGVRSSSTECRN
ncbi:glycoside hydrolase superfamily [Dendryphion nanum]|uniref:beta-glucosidase n=1 Tax=Dendryphion nanum TaxID=256645 RepID=A0A9P9ICN9_9PLEO|nr:glycoside hydrolase superfamily [Dendryphion nanum]